MTKVEGKIKEMWPLSWPIDEKRTRPDMRRTMASWKKNANQYREDLKAELIRMGSPVFLISSNIPVSQRDSLERGGLEPLDIGVAVYFTRKQKDDFDWQDVFNIHDPAPTNEQVDNAFREKAKLYHPDAPGGDRAMFEQLTKHRDNAKRWINRKTNQDFSHVIACDAFKEVRLNMAAIVMSIKAIRQLERCGTSSIMERAFKGFAAITEGATNGTASA